MAIVKTKPIVEWGEDLVNGVRMLDGQHRLLVELLNTLGQAIDQRQSAENATNLLTKLIDGARLHFATEERLMQAVAYPAYRRHKSEHDALLERVLAAQRQLAAGQGIVNSAFVAFLREWLTQHIQEADARLGSYLRGKGLT